jgi:hypothetical protein
MRRKALFGSATVLGAALALPPGCDDTRRNPDVCHSEPCEEGFHCNALQRCVPNVVVAADASAEGGRLDGSAEADAADAAVDGDADSDGAPLVDATGDSLSDSAGEEAAPTADAPPDVSSSVDGAAE